MPDGSDFSNATAHAELLGRLRHAASGNSATPDGVTLVGMSRCDVAATSVLTVTTGWTTDVETRAGVDTVRAAVWCRNSAELTATLTRDLDAEAASLEAAHRLAALIGVPESDFGTEPGSLPELPSLRGPYCVPDTCVDCGGGGVRTCAEPGCRGGNIPCAHDQDGEPCDLCGGRGMRRCTVCRGTGVVPCESCGGVGRFTHIHRPRLTVTVSRGVALPADAPEAAWLVLESAGYDGFDRLVEAAPMTVRHSGPNLLYERAGVLPVVTLSCVCDGIAFTVDAVGADGEVPVMPPFLDTVLEPLAARIAESDGPDAVDLAGGARFTAAIADAIVRGEEPDFDALVADHAGAVSRGFAERVTDTLRDGFERTARSIGRRVWLVAAVALAVPLAVVATLDVPTRLTGATGETPAPLPLRLFWDLGVPLLSGLVVWLLARDLVRRALNGAFLAETRPPRGGAPALPVLGAVAALYLGVLSAWHGVPGASRLPAPLAAARSVAARSMTEPPPAVPTRLLSAEERVAAVQRALARLGRYDGAIDGKPGEATKAGLDSLASLVEAPAGDPADMALAIASDRVPIRLDTPGLLVGAGWSNATRLRLGPEDGRRIATAMAAAATTPGETQDWVSADGLRSGRITVTGHANDPTGRQRPCVAFTHIVTTLAGRDPGVPARACRFDGRWSLSE